MMTRITAKPLRQAEFDARSWRMGGCAGTGNAHFVCDSAKIDGE